jgi:hypothetical protein
MSGFVRPSRVGPRELKHAMSESASVNEEPHQDEVMDHVVPPMSIHCFLVVNAPTAITFSEVPGEPIVRSQSAGRQ